MLSHRMKYSSLLYACGFLNGFESFRVVLIHLRPTLAKYTNGLAKNILIIEVGKTVYISYIYNLIDGAIH